MKKTLVALSVAAFAASASAVTVFDNEGTKITFDGSLRLVLEQQKTATNGNGNEAHSNLRNDGTRFGVRVHHELGDGFYALGRLEFRFDGSSTTADKFGNLYAKRAYVGLGKKELGEVTFGRQLTIADDVGWTTDYSYGFIPGYTQAEGTAVVRYDYKAIEGLQVGVNYNFTESRDSETDNTTVNTIKNGYGIGFTYNPADNPFAVEAAYTRNNYATGAGAKHYADGVEVAFGYDVIPNLKLVLDVGFGNEKLGNAKARGWFLAPGAQYQVTPKTKIYGNYLYEHNKFTGDFTTANGVIGAGGKLAKIGNATGADEKEKAHGFLLGVDYKLHKHVVTYVEGKYVRTKGYNANDVAGNKVVNKAIGVGMRVFW